VIEGDAIVGTVLVLLRSPIREIRKASLTFLRFALSVLPPHRIQPHLPFVMEAIGEWTRDPSNRFRGVVKILLSKMLRRVGYAALAPLVPESQRKVLSNLRKIEKRRHRKPEKDEDANERYDKTIKKLWTKKEKEGGDAGADTDGEASDGMDEEEDEDLFRARGMTGGGNDRWIMEPTDSEAALDFLDPKSIKYLVSNNPARKPVVETSTESLQKLQDGRLVILDPEISKQRQKDRQLLEKELGIPTTGATSLKRSLDDDDDDQLQDLEPAPVQNRVYKTYARKKPKKETENLMKGVHTGEEYRSKKAQGDVAKKGKPEPYAYYPLNPRHLNKRSKPKVMGQYQGIVNAAKKGSQVKSSKKKSQK